MEINEEDLRLITEIVNTVTPEDILTELTEADAFVQLAWLDHGLEVISGHIRTMYATAYADYKGQLKHFKLTLPRGEE